jgi:hypothetical protein
VLVALMLHFLAIGRAPDQISAAGSLRSASGHGQAV